MAEVKWIKLATNIFDNRKIKQIEAMPESNAIIVTWIKLLCLAGNINDGGLIYITKEIPYTEQMLSNQFGIPLATIQLALKTFERFEMVEIVDNIMLISNWDKYQSADKLSDLKEYNRIKQRESRERRKLLENVNDMSMTCQHRLDKKEDKEKEKSNISRFTPPTLEEVTAYCKERNNNVDPNRFINFYESKGWMVGKNHMKDWKACVRTWEQPKQFSSNEMQCADANVDDIREKLFGGNK